MNKIDLPISFVKRTLVILAIAAFSVEILISGGQDPNRGQSLRTAGLSAETLMAINTVGDDLDKLNESQEKLVKAAGEIESLYLQLSRKVKEVSRLALDAGKSRSLETQTLFLAIQEMREMEIGFNLQYNMLQNEISRENQQYRMVSNIMKNKHDTAKNSINIIR
jgi:hypothetical protein